MILWSIFPVFALHHLSFKTELSRDAVNNALNLRKFCVDCLSRALENANQALESVLRKAAVWDYVNRYSINDRQRLVINRMLDGFIGNLTSSKYAKLAKCSHDTALRDIHQLMEYGVLSKNPSGGRSTSYILITKIIILY